MKETFHWREESDSQKRKLDPISGQPKVSKVSFFPWIMGNCPQAVGDLAHGKVPCDPIEPEFSFSFPPAFPDIRLVRC